MKPSAWLTRHAQNAIGTLGALSRNPVGSALTVLVIAIALALPAALGLLVQAGRSVAGNLDDIRDFSVYLKPGLPEADARGLAGRIGERTEVEEVRLISADEALEELRRDPGFGDALAALPENPLPHTLVVRPVGSATPDAVARVAEELRGLPEVDVVKLDAAWLARLNAILDLVRRGVLIAAALLGAAVIIIVGNTIRLDIQNRAAEIEVIKLLGGSDGFVRRPFLYLGLWYGTFGGLCAVLIVLVTLFALGEPVARLAGLYGTRLELLGPDPAMALAVIGGGALAGWAGAWIAVARHLAAIQPRV